MKKKKNRNVWEVLLPHNLVRKVLKWTNFAFRVYAMLQPSSTRFSSSRIPVKCQVSQFLIYHKIHHKHKVFSTRNMIWSLVCLFYRRWSESNKIHLQTSRTAILEQLGEMLHALQITHIIEKANSTTKHALTQPVIQQELNWEKYESRGNHIPGFSH